METPPPTLQPQLVVIHDFDRRVDDELTLRIGDFIHILEYDEGFDDGWYSGYNLNTHQSGLFPFVFTTALQGGADSVTPMSGASITNSGLVRPLNSPYASDQNVSSDTNLTPTSTNQQQQQQQQLVNVDPMLNDIEEALSELSPRDNSLGIDSPPRAVDMPASQIQSWTSQQVALHFAQLGFDAYVVQNFMRHNIRGAILLELDLNMLKEIDIPTFGTRFEIFKEIERLRKLVEQGKSLSTFVAGINSSTATASSSEPDENLLSASHDRNKSFDRTWNFQQQQQSNSPPIQQPQRSKQRTLSTDEFSKPSSFSHHGSNSINNSKSDIGGPPPIAADSTGSSPRPTSYIERFRSRTSLQDEAVFEDQLSLRPVRSYASGATRQSRVSVNHHHNRYSSITSVQEVHGSLIHGGDSQQQQPLQEPEEIQDNNPRTESMTSSSNASFGRNHMAGAMTDEEGSRGSKQMPVDISSETSSSLMTPHSSAASGTNSSNSKKVVIEESDWPKSENNNNNNNDSSNGTRPTRAKILRSTSAHNLKKRMQPQKTQTSAFLEGIRTITPQEASKTADFSGWMAKRGGSGMGTWKSRFFTLHGTRLSYFSSMSDFKEKGLIDITSHRVLPSKDNEGRLVALYAAGTGNGRFCFKLIPPAPGVRKGLTFTAPKMHYFAVDSHDNLRSWMGALMKATIDRDDSVPVISSCVTPTVTLNKARQMLQEENERRIQQLESQKQVNGGGTNGLLQGTSQSSISRDLKLKSAS